MRQKITIFLTILLLTGSINIFAQEANEIDLFKEDKPLNWSTSDTLYTYKWNEGSGNWTIYQREIRKFNKRDKPMTLFLQTKDNVKDKWINSIRTSYTYDTNGNEVQELVEVWNTDFQDWLNAELKTTGYDNMGNRSEILFQEWHRPVGEWINTMRYIIKYSPNGNQNQIVILMYDGAKDSWENYRRFNMEHQSKFAPPKRVFVENWDPYSSEWKMQGRYNIRYNFRGDKTQETRSTWNQSQKNWINGLQLKWEYNKKGNLTLNTKEKWDFSQREWIKASKLTREYTEDGKLLFENEFKWNNQNQSWELLNKFRFSNELEDKNKDL